MNLIKKILSFLVSDLFVGPFLGALFGTGTVVSISAAVIYKTEIIKNYFVVTVPIEELVTSAKAAADSAEQAAISVKDAAASAKDAAASTEASANAAGKVVAFAKDAAASAEASANAAEKAAAFIRGKEFVFLVFFEKEAGIEDLKEDSASPSVMPTLYKDEDKDLLKEFITGLSSAARAKDEKCSSISLEVRGFASSSEWELSDFKTHKNDLMEVCSNFKDINEQCIQKKEVLSREERKECSDSLNVCTANFRASNIYRAFNYALENGADSNIELKLEKWKTYSDMEADLYFKDRKDGYYNEDLGLVNRRVEVRIKGLPQYLNLNTLRQENKVPVR